MEKNHYRSIPIPEWDELQTELRKLREFKRSNSVIIRVEEKSNTIGSHRDVYMGRFHRHIGFDGSSTLRYIYNERVSIDANIGASVMRLVPTLDIEVKRLIEESHEANKGTREYLESKLDELHKKGEQLHSIDMQLEHRESKVYKGEEIVNAWKIRFWVLLTLVVILFGGIKSCSAQRKPIYTAMEITHIGLQTADVYLTYKGLKAGAYEVNPAAAWLIDRNLLIPAKVVGTTAFLYTCRRLHSHDQRLATWYLIGGNLLYSAVVFNNYQVTLRMKI
jgi:hypothetical protein